MKRILSVLVALLLLTGCAASGPRTSEESTMPAAQSAEFACDAVFFGDSITADGNFDELFPALRVVNLGVYGDRLEDLLRRVPRVKEERPARIFLLGGINSLTPSNAESCAGQYRTLLVSLRRACPEADICVQTVLPVAEQTDQDAHINDAVRSFNRMLRELADELGMDCIDLYACYERDGFLDPALTRDGLHLNFNAYGPWADAVRPFLGES